MPTVTAIMQARMGSSRLAGKVLLEVEGTTFLEHSFNRLKMASQIDTCVIATTTKPADEAILNFCKQRGWNCIKGSESDVLDRYYQAALAYPADIIVRVTSDCPLLDPAIINQVVEAVGSDFPNTAYASNVLPSRTFPRGLDVEVFTFAALEKAWNEATESSHREHVTPFINSQPHQFPQTCITTPSDESHHRWTLDTQEDHDLLKRILSEAPSPASWETILNLVNSNPDWSKINQAIEQKKV